MTLILLTFKTLMSTCGGVALILAAIAAVRGSLLKPPAAENRALERQSTSAAADGFHGIRELERPQPVRADAGELSVFTDRGYSRSFAVLGLHRWLHTVADTLERVDARLVTPVLEAHQRTIERGIAEVQA